FPNNEKRKLVHLSGTLPVLYQGSQYNVPVCIWLHETHPASRPRCFVCPSVSMVINLSCPYVDSSGTITLDGLKNWTPGVSNLSLLLSEMMLAFQKDTPLYARCVAQAPPPAGVQVSVEVSSSSSLQSQCVSLGSSYPAPLKGPIVHDERNEHRKTFALGSQERGADIQQRLPGPGLEPGTGASKTIASIYGCVLNYYTTSGAAVSTFLTLEHIWAQFIAQQVSLSDELTPPSYFPMSKGIAQSSSPSNGSGLP
ncbi:hypothetical protein ATANTOWER_017780, partial [Ataeniobius toweri]|nr:hypothetical protein [Ataeniobius toweri]